MEEEPPGQREEQVGGQVLSLLWLQQGLRGECEENSIGKNS